MTAKEKEMQKSIVKILEGINGAEAVAVLNNLNDSIGNTDPWYHIYPISELGKFIKETNPVEVYRILDENGYSQQSGYFTLNEGGKEVCEFIDADIYLMDFDVCLPDLAKFMIRHGNSLGIKSIDHMLNTNSLCKEIVEKHFTEMFVEFEDSLGIEDGGVIDYFADPCDVFYRLQDEMVTALSKVAEDWLRMKDDFDEEE